MFFGHTRSPADSDDMGLWELGGRVVMMVGSPNDAFWDVDELHGDEFLQLVQAVYIFDLIAELGAVFIK